MIADQIAEQHLRLVRHKDGFISAACPFHKGGQERRPSFWIDKKSGRWGCFACQAKGSSLRNLLKDLGVNDRTLDVQLAQAEKEAKKQDAVDRVKLEAKNRAEFKGQYELPESLLGVYDWAPVALIEAGYPEEVLQEHDIGFDTQRNRITFPIRDMYGTLIGVSGRSTDGSEPKYLVYSGRRVVNGQPYMGELGEWYPDYSNEGIRDHLWRGNFVLPDLMAQDHGQLIIVEGYKAALWMVSNGWPNTVALMGSHMSAGQERLIRRLGAEVFVLLDNNEPGRDGSRNICQRLGVSSFPVYECSYPAHAKTSAQPDDLTGDELAEVLATSQRVGGKYVFQSRVSSSRKQRSSSGWRERR